MHCKNNLRCLAVSLLVSIMAAMPATAEIYKWTDENGRVHFSDQKPESQHQTIKMKSLGTPGDNKKSMGISDRSQRFLRAVEEERQLAQQQRAEKEQELANKRAQCDKVAKELTYLRDQYRWYTAGDAGEPRFMSDEEIDQYRAEYEAFHNKYCQ